MDNKKTESAFPLLVSRITSKGRVFELIQGMSELPMGESFEVIQQNSNEGAADLAIQMYNKGWTEAETIYAEE